MLDSYRGFFNRCNNSLLKLTVTIALGFIIYISCFSTTVFAGSRADSESNDMGSRALAYDFTLEFEVNVFTIDPKDDGVVVCWLNNTGDNADQYSLEIEEVPTGWTAFFDNGKTSLSSISVGVGKYDLIQIYVHAPESGEATLNVICKSQSTSDEKNAQVQLEAKYIVKVVLKDIKNVHSVRAGENTTFTLEIKNYQDISDTVTLSIQHTDIKFQNKPDDTKWGVNFDNDVITLAAEESKFVVLTVFAPNFGEPGDKITLIVIANPSSTTQEFKCPQDLISEIPKVYNITYNVTLDPPDQLTLPNSTVNYTLILQNNGNIDDVITLKIHENSNNWGIFFFEDGLLFFPNQDSIEMKVKEIVIFQLEIDIPLDASATTQTNKPHVIEYGIYSDKQGAIKSINNIIIKTQVQLISDIEIYIPEYDSNIDVGKVSYREIIAHNKGNGNANLEVSIPKDLIPTGWEISIYSVKNTKEINQTQRVDFNKPIVFDEFEIDKIEYLPEVVFKYRNITLNLGANKQAYVVLSITPPTSGKAGTETFTIYGESVSANIDTTTKSMLLNLQLSKLSVSPIKVDPEIPTPDEKVKVSFNITNDYHVSANNFKVTLIEINERGVITVVDSKDISTLESGEKQTVSFTWTPQEATEKGYILEAKLKGDIIPNDNTAPFRRQNVFVIDKPPKAESEENVLLIALAIIIILFIIVLIIMLVIGQKRAKEKSDKSEERKKPKEEPTRQLGRVGKPKAKTDSKSTSTGKRPRQGPPQKIRKSK